jgi:hypothetical protein
LMIFVSESIIDVLGTHVPYDCQRCSISDPWMLIMQGKKKSSECSYAYLCKSLGAFASDQV